MGLSLKFNFSLLEVVVTLHRHSVTRPADIFFFIVSLGTGELSFSLSTSRATEVVDRQLPEGETPESLLSKLLRDELPEVLLPLLSGDEG